MIPSMSPKRPEHILPRRSALGSPVSRTSARKCGPAPAPPVRPRDRQVRDLMTSRVFALAPEDSLATLYDLMDARHVRHVPIVENGDELVGLVTHEDLVTRTGDLPLSAERDLLERRRIANIMRAEPDTIEPDASLRDAAEMLFENKMGCLPVVEGLRLVGILTESDFVRDFIERN